MPNSGSTTATRLGDYVQLLVRHRLTVTLGLLLGLASAVAYLVGAEPGYVSRASVVVTPIPTAAQDAPRQAAGRVNLDTEAQLVTSDRTAAAAAEGMGLPAADGAALADEITVSVPPNSGVLSISFRAGTADTAQRGAEAFAQAYLDARQTAATAALAAQVDQIQARIDVLDQELEDLNRRIDRLPEGSAELAVALDREAGTVARRAALVDQRSQAESTPVSSGQVIRSAARPSAPANPDPYRALTAGAALGLLAGIGGAAFRQRWDDRLRSAADLARLTSVPILATLPTPLRADGADRAPGGPNALAVARLTHLVGAALADEEKQVVLVLGVRRGGGEVAASLASALARSGEPVCLLDAATSGPAVPSAAEPEGANPRAAALGRDPDDAAASLSRRRLAEVIDGLTSAHSYVVVHGPPTTEGVDAQSLALAADVVVLVVEAGRTRARDVTEAVAEMESVHRSVLGAVVLGDRRPSPGRAGTRGPRRTAAVDAGTRTTSVAIPGGRQEPVPAGTRPAAAGGSGDDVPGREPSLTQGRAR